MHATLRLSLEGPQTDVLASISTSGSGPDWQLLRLAGSAYSARQSSEDADQDGQHITWERYERLDTNFPERMPAMLGPR